MPKKKLIAIASEDELGLDGEVSAHFGRCPYYVLAEVNDNTVLESQVVANPFYYEHRPRMVPQFIRNMGADVIIAGGMGPRAIEMLHGYGIDVATGVAGNIGKVIEAYLRGEHRGVVPCAHDHPDSCGGHGR
jgi:predicted Fe-Mo cluster-binding NifX family protein